MSDLPDSPSTPAARPEAPPDSLMARLRRVAAYFGTAPRLWAYAVLATLVGALTEAAIPALLKPLLDRGFTEGTLPLWTVPVGVLVMFFLRGGAQFAAQ